MTSRDAAGRSVPTAPLATPRGSGEYGQARVGDESMADVARDHPMERETTLFTVRLRCACGHVSPRFWRGTFLPSVLAMWEAGHWAALLGVPMFRSIDDIHAGR